MKETAHRTLHFALPLAVILFLTSSCASTGPKVTREERQKKEAEFNAKFLEASPQWLPRIYRIGYRLITSPLPEDTDKKPKYGFIGVGVDDLKDYARKTYSIPKSVKGVLAFGVYPGSKAGHLDLQPGDVIQKLGKKKIKNLGGYFKAMRGAESDVLKAQIYRRGKLIEIDLPVEKVYYNTQFFLAPTPDLDAHAQFSKINVGIGAIRYCRNDDELAVIMSHELAHVTLKHSLKKMGTGISSGIAFGVAAAAINAVSLPGVGDLAMAPFRTATDAVVSRRYEAEADYRGMKHAFHSGFNVQSGSKVFSRLATDAPSYNLLAYTFASHPKTSERFLRLEKIVDEFKTQYPGKFEVQAESQDWELIIPMRAGESLEEALEGILQQERLKISKAAEPGGAGVPVSAAKVA